MAKYHVGVATCSCLGLGTQDKVSVSLVGAVGEPHLQLLDVCGKDLISV